MVPCSTRSCRSADPSRPLGHGPSTPPPTGSRSARASCSSCSSGSGARGRRAGVTAPDGRFYVAREAEPWPENEAGLPRRAAVSAFGFGGTNGHVTLEELVPAYRRGLVGLDEPRAASARAVSPESE